MIKDPAIWPRFMGLKLCLSSEIEQLKPIFLPVSLAKLHPAFLLCYSPKSNKISSVSLLEDATGEAELRTLNTM